jgi:V8-like Glu-specific endopeptidase
MKHGALFILTLLVIAPWAHAFPIAKLSGRMSLSQLASFSDRDFNFDGIVALDNCSGSIVRFENSQDTDLAYVLTNGHCYEAGFAEPGAFTSHAPSSRSFDILNSNSESIGTVNATEVVYSTMTGTDITIYRLGSTYADIKSQYGVNALTLATVAPLEKAKIEVISGFWHRGYACSIEKIVTHLLEGGHTFDASLRYSRPGCDTIGGTSGSPVLAAGTRTVIAINNTGNDNGEKCTEDNPCEVNDDGSIYFEKGLSYAQQTALIYSCVNANREIELTMSGCKLVHGN